jgi:hypothetical protein
MKQAIKLSIAGLFCLLFVACGSAPKKQKPMIPKPLVNVVPQKPMVQIPVAPPPPPPFFAHLLLGLGTVGVVEQLGQPDLVRQDETAILWRYKGNQCPLLVFFHPNQNGTSLVSHVDSPLDTQDVCANALRKKHRGH